MQGGEEEREMGLCEENERESLFEPLPILFKAACLAA